MEGSHTTEVSNLTKEEEQDRNNVNKVPSNPYEQKIRAVLFLPYWVRLLCFQTVEYLSRGYFRVLAIHSTCHTSWCHEFSEEKA